MELEDSGSIPDVFISSSIRWLNTLRTCQSKVVRCQHTEVEIKLASAVLHGVTKGINRQRLRQKIFRILGMVIFINLLALQNPLVIFCDQHLTTKMLVLVVLPKPRVKKNSGEVHCAPMHVVQDARTFFVVQR